MMSEHQYQNLVRSYKSKSLYSAILNWRSHLEGPEETGYDENELKTLRENSEGREFSSGK